MDLFYELKQIKAIDDVWKYVLSTIKQEYQLSDDLLNLFCLFFSLIDDGNVCIPLDVQQLKAKWNRKLNGLEAKSAVDYDNIIEKGISAIKEFSPENPLIFRCTDATDIRKNNMFVICNGWLFIEKFFNAKQIIEESVKTLFSEKTASETDDKDAAIQDIKSKYDYIKQDLQTLKQTNFELSLEQATAIARAKNGENLIISGGPGTGKTTVICYLLLELLSVNPGQQIYMAAPSGKAAKRMKESLTGALTNLKPSERSHQENSCAKISEIQPVTIHRLLGVAGGYMREPKKFPSGSIFVIDEASMIDIVLFSKLLNEIEQTPNARVFILGDQDQIPSVQPGAVFSDLIKRYRGTNSMIELVKSQRFPENSEIYKLKEHIRHGKDISVSLLENISDDWKQELQQNQQDLQNGDKKYPVKYLTISKYDDVQKSVKDWYDAFYNDQEYTKVYSCLDLTSPNISDTLDAIWSRTETAKILCAENRGMHGTDNVNKIICDYIKGKDVTTPENNSDTFFVGEQIIITQNQHLYDLSNGDIGIIVSLNNKKYIMIKRAKGINESDTMAQGDLILRCGNYIFYPWYLLPTDSLAPAYAITIHKSQGSEYNNILVFMPDLNNSPLLNRQILYTAITRTKNATYIVSTRENLKTAIENQDTRDTGLFI